MEHLDEARILQQAGSLEEAEAVCATLAEDVGEAPDTLALMGLVLLQRGRQTEGRGLVERAAKAPPDGAAAASDLGAGLLLCGDPARARDILDQAATTHEADGVVFNRLGTACLALDDLDGAEDAFSQAVLRRPDWAAPHNNLGGVMLRQDKPDEALRHYDRALALEPEHAQALDGRAKALVALDRADEAIGRLEAELAAAPDSVALRRRLARVMVLEERYQEAEDTLRDAAERDPAEAGVWAELAALLLNQDRYAAAAEALEQAWALVPDDVGVHCALAAVHIERGKLYDAREAVERAFELDPEAAQCYLVRAELLVAEDDYAGAEHDLRRALALAPGAAGAWCSLGHTLMWIGRLDEAVDCFERAAELNPSAPAALVEARGLPDDPAAIERMERLADNRLMPREARSAKCFALTKMFERRGDHDQAFDYAARGNRAERELIDYGAARHRAGVDRIIETFDAKLFDRLRGAGVSSDRPVFVVGLPRSGTTLVEQVLASHPAVHGAGELGTVAAIKRRLPEILNTLAPYPHCMALFKPETAKRVAAGYLRAIERLDADAARVVDKLPHNFLHLGLISLMFPKAKIIHVVREPRDVAISTYFANFKHRAGGMAYAYDLADIGHMIDDHNRVMAHWRRVLPIEIHEVRYEALVDDLEGHARGLLGFIGLDWDDRVLDFHRTERTVRTGSVWQVRQPLYASSVERWRAYAEHLGPLEAVLDNSDD